MLEVRKLEAYATWQSADAIRASIELLGIELL
jgi:hypothetical protein